MNHFCSQASKLTSDTSERSLNWKERLSLRIHLLMCRMCREDTHNAQLLSRFFQEARSDVQAPSNIILSEDSRERIRKNLSCSSDETSS